MKKRFLCIILICLFSLNLVACSSDFYPDDEIFTIPEDEMNHIMTEEPSNEVVE